jgi:uncharacterized protein YdiU (UPF0061 family)
LLPLIGTEQEQAVALATESINAFSAKFQQAWLEAMRWKLGLLQKHAQDAELFSELLDVMHRTQADYTVTFRGLVNHLERDSSGSGVEVALHAHEDFRAWLRKWEDRGAAELVSPAARIELMQRANPCYIPRNHLIEEVIAAATNEEDFAPFEALLSVVLRPFDEQPSAAAYALPPRPDQRVLETFCGT